MKFLCIRCDEAMKLERVGRPEDGSLDVVFACAGCGNRVAMLTNPMEAQLVRSLDVRIGGRTSPGEPMEFIRSMLAPGREAGREATSPGAPASGATPPSACPFSAMANLGAPSPAPGEGSGGPGMDPAIRQPGNWATGHSGATQQASGSSDDQIGWSPEAERRLEHVPEFIRPMVRLGIEQFAAKRGYRRISEDVMEEARGILGM